MPSRPLKVNRGKVARAGADATEGHLGHALGGKAGNEAVAQVAHAADVDVAHRVVVSIRKDREEVEVLRGSLHGVVWVLQAAQLHLRLSSCLAAPMGATSCSGLASEWILEPPSLSQKVTNAPMSFVNVLRQLVKAGRRQAPASGAGARPRARLGLGQGHGVQASGEGARRVVGLRLHTEAGLRGGAAACGAA